MYKVISTWSGPTDKLVVDGAFFRDAFLNLDAESAWEQVTFPGKEGATIVDTSTPGAVVRTAIYDTEEHATAASQLGKSRPAENFKEGAVGSHKYWQYIKDNNITVTTEITPA